MPRLKVREFRVTTNKFTGARAYYISDNGRPFFRVGQETFRTLDAMAERKDCFYTTSDAKFTRQHHSCYY